MAVFPLFYCIYCTVQSTCGHFQLDSQWWKQDFQKDVDFKKKINLLK